MPRGATSFFGKLDARMTTEMLPRDIHGISVRAVSERVARAVATNRRGAAFGLFSVETGALVYEDRFSFNINADRYFPEPTTSPDRNRDPQARRVTRLAPQQKALRNRKLLWPASRDARADTC